MSEVELGRACGCGGELPNLPYQKHHIAMWSKSCLSDGNHRPLAAMITLRSTKRAKKPKRYSHQNGQRASDQFKTLLRLPTNRPENRAF
jgi:hypothetical protein